MVPKVKWDKFAKACRKQRGEQSLRACAKALGLEHSTLYRAEQSCPIRVAEFLWLCKWLSADPNEFT